MYGLRRQSIRSTIRAITLVAAITSLLLTMVTPFVGAAHADLDLDEWVDDPPPPYPTFPHDPEATVYREVGSDANATCLQLAGEEASGEVKFGNAADVANNAPVTIQDGGFEVTITSVYDADVDGVTWTFFDFESTGKPVSAVFVKQADGGAFFDYRDDPTWADTHLHSIKADDWSHISFCYNPRASVTVTKKVANNEGGTAQPGDFDLFVDDDEVTSGDPQSLPPGTYTISESIPASLTGQYTPGGIDCGDKGTTDSTSIDITVGDGDIVTCTVTNHDVPGSLTLLKDVVNDDGGDADFSDFTPTVSPSGSIDFQDVDTADPVATPVYADEYTIGEQDADGYELTSIDCGDGNSDDTDPTTLTIDIGLNEHVTCTFVNDDQAASIIVKKVIEDDDELYDAEQADFVPTVDGEDEAWDTPITVTPGTYEIDERDSDDGPDWLADGRFVQTDVECGDDRSASATVGLGDLVTCTITNTAVGAGLTLVKDVTNTWGGDLEAADFTLEVNGDEVTQGDETETFPAGTYDISEEAEDGYELVRVRCLEGVGEDRSEILDETDPDELADLEIDDLVVGPGDVVVCTFYNQDLPGELTVIKDVVNDDGGDATEADFTASVDYTSDGGTVTDDNEPDASPGWGETQDVPQGDYVVGEGDIAGELGYTLTGVACYESDDVTNGEPDEGAEALATDDEAAELAIGHGDDVTCIVTNDDVPAQLTLVKRVINNSGRSLTPADEFGVTLDGEVRELTPDDPADGYDSQASVTIENLDADTYVVGEEGASNYRLTSITCTDASGATVASGTPTASVTLDLGDDVTCVLVNDDTPPPPPPDEPPTIVLRKIVVNDDGGTLTQDAFPVTLDGGEVAWDDMMTIEEGTHTVAEETQPGYLAGDWGGDCDADGSLDASDGNAYECTITNDDVPAGLTVVKEVVNDDGASAEPSDFTLVVTPDGGDPVEVTSGQQGAFDAGTYTISEEQLPGYALDSISCDNGATTTDDELTVAVGLGEAVICTVVNDDLPIGIEVIKVPDVTTVDYTVGSDEDVVITYTYTVTNTGDTTLADLSMVDDVLGPIDLGVDVLEPGQVVVVEAQHLVTDADADAGEIVNVVDVEGTSPDGRAAVDDDDAEVTVNEIEVLPNVIERPEPAPEPAPMQLPRTGVDTGAMALFAALIAGLGAMLLVAIDATTPAPARRRRRRD